MNDSWRAPVSAGFRLVDMAKNDDLKGRLVL